MLDGEVKESDLASDDFVVFWNYFTTPYLGHLQVCWTYSLAGPSYWKVTVVKLSAAFR